MVEKKKTITTISINFKNYVYRATRWTINKLFKSSLIRHAFYTSNFVKYFNREKYNEYKRLELEQPVVAIKILDKNGRRKSTKNPVLVERTFNVNCEARDAKLEQWFKFFGGVNFYAADLHKEKDCGNYYLNYKVPLTWISWITKQHYIFSTTTDEAIVLAKEFLRDN